jgi:hypothetical protein
MIVANKITPQTVEHFDPSGNSLGFLTDLENLELRCQIAENKGKDIKVLLTHVGLYTFILLGFLAGYSGFIYHYSFEPVLYFCLVNFALHLFTDSQTSQLTTYYYKKSDMRMFWVVVGFDQFLHALALIWTAHLFLTI